MSKTDTTTDPYAVVMAAVDAFAVEVHRGARLDGIDDRIIDAGLAVRVEAERLVLGQQIAVLEAVGAELGADCRAGAACKNPRCWKLAELRAALEALDEEGE